MKQLITKIGILMALLSVFTNTYAYDFEVEGICYAVISLDELTCAVTYRSEEYNSYSGTINIPAAVTYNGRKFCVTGIGRAAFRDCENLLAVMLPESITSIGSSAFENCYNVEQINLPNTISVIGEGAFESCRKLESVVIPSSLEKLSSNLFYDCRALNEIIIPSNIKILGENVFSFSGVERCIIEDDDTPISMSGAFIASETSIYHGSFSNSNIKYLYLGRNYTRVRASTSNSFYSPFLAVHTIEEVIIGGRVTELPANSFVNVRRIEYGTHQPNYEPLSNFTKFKVLDGSEELKFITNIWGNWNSSVKDEGISDFRHIKSAVIERNINWRDNIGSLGGSGIFGENDIEDVVLDKSFTTVNEYMFNRCFKLKTIKLGDNVTTIFNKAFSRTDDLMKIILITNRPPVFNGNPDFSNNQYLNAEIFVPDDSQELYKEADFWKSFWNIKGLSLLSGIKNVEHTSSSMSIISENGSIRVINKDEGNTVRVFSIHGTKITETRDAEIHNLPNGVYIVTVGDKSFKVFVR